MASLFQFSIRSLLVAVAFVSLGIAALVNTNAWWDAAMWGVAVFTLAVAVLLAIYRRGEQRAFWLGFSILGSLYLAILVHSWTPYQNPQVARVDPSAHSSLITTRLAHLAYYAITPDAQSQAWVPSQLGTPISTMMSGMSSAIGSSGMGPMGGTVVVPNPNYVSIDQFTNIAHALWLLLIAAIGGKVAQVACRTRPVAP